MKKAILIFLCSVTVNAQSFKVKEVFGDVKYQNGNSEKWILLLEGSKVSDDAIIITSNNSFVELEGQEVSFKLNESSAVSVSSIKKMNTDDLLLALAMEDMMNALKEIKKNSDNTAVYGTESGQKPTLFIKSDNFGIKRLNGAVQLAKYNLQESAVVTARETYRKYPDTRTISSYRIYFADILYTKGLYEEALDEYLEIQKLQLTENDRKVVNDNAESIKMKLLDK